MKQPSSSFFFCDVVKSSEWHKPHFEEDLERVVEEFLFVYLNNLFFLFLCHSIHTPAMAANAEEEGGCFDFEVHGKVQGNNHPCISWIVFSSSWIANLLTNHLSYVVLCGSKVSFSGLSNLHQFIRMHWARLTVIHKKCHRKFTKEKARELGIVGWVMNTEKGTVLGHAQSSDPAALQQLYVNDICIFSHWFPPAPLSIHLFIEIGWW